MQELQEKTPQKKGSSEGPAAIFAFPEANIVFEPLETIVCSTHSWTIILCFLDRDLW